MSRYAPWRRAALALQAIIIVGLPFLRVGGESALRFDVPTLRLHFFGTSLHIDELFVVLAALLLITFLFLLVTLLFGRIWCGWMCPQTLLTELTPGLGHHIEKRKRPRTLLGAVSFATGLSLLVSANILWYFVEPGDFFRQLGDGTMHPVTAWSWATLFVVILADLLWLRQRFCVHMCPYAMLQGVLFDRHTMVIGYDRERGQRDCLDDGLCVRVCPAEIDIRDGLQAACIGCTKCIDACVRVLAKKSKPTLIHYMFGHVGGSPRLARPTALLLAAASTVSLIAVIAVASTRERFTMTVTDGALFPPRLTAAGLPVNGYSVTLDNRGDAPLTVGLSAASDGLQLTLRPATVELGPGQRRNVRLFVTASKPGRGPPRPVDITATPHQPTRERATGRVHFAFPEQG